MKPFKKHPHHHRCREKVDLKNLFNPLIKRNIMSTPAQKAKDSLSIADLTPEQVQALLSQLPPEMLKQATNEFAKSQAQLIAEKEKAYAELEAQVIPKIATDYLAWVEAGKLLKTAIFSELKSLIDLKFELVEFKDKAVFSKLRTQKSLTFNVAPFTVRVGRRAKDTFNHDAKVGLAKIEEYINSTHIAPAVSSLLISLIEKDKNGNLTPSSIMALQRNLYDENTKSGVNDESFTEGVRLLIKSWRKKMTCFYAEVGKEDNLAKTVFEPGSFSAYELPLEIDFNYFSDEDSLAE